MWSRIAQDLEKVHDGSRILLALLSRDAGDICEREPTRSCSGEMARRDVLRMTQLGYDPSDYVFGLQVCLLSLARHLGDTCPSQNDEKQPWRMRWLTSGDRPRSIRGLWCSAPSS